MNVTPFFIRDKALLDMRSVLKTTSQGQYTDVPWPTYLPAILDGEKTASDFSFLQGWFPIS